MSKVDEIRAAISDFDWTQKKSNINYSSHSIHKYPAKLIPQIPKMFIEKFGIKGGCVLDPYCGSGTTLLEAKLAGMNSIGFDINPLALFISKVKCQNIGIQQTKKEIDLFKELFFDKKQPYCLRLPYKEAITWFPNQALNQINTIWFEIDSFECQASTKDIIKIAFSDILRAVSYQRNDEFKLYRIDPEERPGFYVDPLPLLFQKIDKIYSQLSILKTNTQEMKTNVSIFNYDSSSSGKKPTPMIGRRSIRMVVTSPPYGDSSTTVAYGQFSWLSNRILNMTPDSKQGGVDKILMGGKPKKRLYVRKFGTLPIILSLIHPKLRVKVKSFFSDYLRSIKTVSSLLKSGGICCYVVADRTVDNQIIPMAEFTKLAFEKYGLQHVGTYKRNMIGKRLPLKNNKSSLINEEIIVVMYKD